MLKWIWPLSVRKIPFRVLSPEGDCASQISRRVGADVVSAIVFDPRSYLKPAIAAMRAVCEARYLDFGAVGQAEKIKAIPLEKMVAKYSK